MPSEPPPDRAMTDRVIVRQDGRVLTLTLNRPAVLNALDRATLAALGAAIDAAGRETSVGAVVVTGAGERAFAAGADIRELADQSPAAAEEHARFAHSVFRRLETLGKPVIAAINGVALGGGCELALACTLRLAAETATFGQPEINLGLIPGHGGSQRLPRLVGRGRALEMLLTGQPISAAEAWRIGLVNRVVPLAGLQADAGALARDVAAKPAAALRYLLAAVNDGGDLPLPAAEAYEAALFGLVAATGDMREGTRAFLEKRPPIFTGQ